MAQGDTSSSSRIRVLLTDDELQASAIDDLSNKFLDWLKLSKETTGGRKTRSANRRADMIFDEIMSFKLPPIKLAYQSTSPNKAVQSNSAKSSVVDDTDTASVGSSSGPTTTRILRPRCRTPSVTRQQTTSPCTPTHQNIRAHMKKNLDSNSSSVLSAALNHQHPSVSMTKIRQLLRADSAQKKMEEEKERQERLRLERKAKEERAEAQKKQLLEEKSTTAKMKREKRLLHAAELRKEREKTRLKQKIKEELAKKAQNQIQLPVQDEEPEPEVQAPGRPAEIEVHQVPSNEEPNKNTTRTVEEANKTIIVKKADPPAKKLDETFKKPQDEQNNIEISIHDETSESCGKPKGAQVASWAKAPYLRDAIIAQFSKTDLEIQEQSLNIFGGVQLPVDLDMIFGSSKAVNNRYLHRTSSAVWSPPNRGLKRSSSAVMTPTDPKR